MLATHWSTGSQDSKLLTRMFPEHHFLFLCVQINFLSPTFCCCCLFSCLFSFLFICNFQTRVLTQNHWISCLIVFSTWWQCTPEDAQSLVSKGKTDHFTSQPVVGKDNDWHLVDGKVMCSWNKTKSKMWKIFYSFKKQRWKQLSFDHSFTKLQYRYFCIQFNSIQFIYIAPNYNKCYLKALK